MPARDRPVAALRQAPDSTIWLQAAEAAALIVGEVKRFGIEPDRESVVWSPWKSALYCTLDAVFSARTRYEVVVVPMLKRLDKRAAVSDTPERTFSDFLQDVDRVAGAQRFEQYAADVLQNRQRVGGRLKVAVAYDAAHFFVENGVETMADAAALGDLLRPLILGGLQMQVVGIGPALAYYLLALLGDEDRIKLDTMLLRFWERIGLSPINPMSPAHYEFALGVFRLAAESIETSPARLDKAIWDYESRRDNESNQ